MFHATSRRHLMFATHLTSDHHILHLTSHYTAVCLGATISHHNISKHNMFHSPHITPFHIHNYSTPHPHSTSQHISHHNIFHIALHHTRFHIALHHHIWHHNTLHHFPHLASHYNHSALLNTTIPHHHWHFTSHRNFSHLALWQHFHIPGHHIPHHAIFHILHFNQSHHVWNCYIPHLATFHIAP